MAKLINETSSKLKYLFFERTAKSNRRQCKNQEKMFSNHISDKGLIFRNIKSSQISSIRKQKFNLKMGKIFENSLAKIY